MGSKGLSTPMLQQPTEGNMVQFLIHYIKTRDYTDFVLKFSSGLVKITTGQILKMLASRLPGDEASGVDLVSGKDM